MEKDYIISISHSAIGDMLNTNQVKPHLSKYWCISKENDAHFVTHMEDVLGIYKREYDPHISVICMDEKPVQLLGEIRERVYAKPIRTDADTGLPKPGEVEKLIQNMFVAVRQVYLCSLNRLVDGVMSRH